MKDTHSTMYDGMKKEEECRLGTHGSIVRDTVSFIDGLYLDFGR